jgi:biotin operon repressor
MSLSDARASKVTQESEEDATLENLQQKLEIANAALERAKRALEDIGNDVAKVEKDNYYLRKDITKLEKRAETLESNEVRTKSVLAEEVRKNYLLQKKVKGWTLWAELVQPLIDIGVAIRLRFLQHAGQTVCK